MNSRIAPRRFEGRGAYLTSGDSPRVQQNELERQFEGSEKTSTGVAEGSGSLGDRFTCQGCGIGFDPKRRGQLYHSDACRLASWKKRNKNAATVGETQNILGIVLVMEGKVNGIPCGFCHRLNKVDLSRDGKQKAVCTCGARYFCRSRRLAGGKIEEWGWKKGKERSYFI